MLNRGLEGLLIRRIVLTWIVSLILICRRLRRRRKRESSGIICSAPISLPRCLQSLHTMRASRRWPWWRRYLRRVLWVGGSWVLRGSGLGGACSGALLAAGVPRRVVGFAKHYFGLCI